MTTSSSRPEPGETSLFRAVATGTATEAEFQLLQTKLLADPELRIRFVKYMNLEACLYEVMSDPSQPVPRPVLTSRKHQLVKIAAFSVASLLIGALAALWVSHRTLPVESSVAPSQMAGRELEQTAHSSIATIDVQEEKASHRPEFVFVETDQTPPPEVAIVTFLESGDGQRKLEGIQVGDRLRPGLVTWPSGTLHLDFLNGAQVVLNGPAKLRIHSLSLVTLLEGNAAARVPPSARGFVMNAPDVAVVDIGTEFSLHVDENGESDVQVTDGEVVVSLLGMDGNTLRSEVVGQSGSLRVSRNGVSLGPTISADVSASRIPDRPLPPLHINEDYVRTIQQAQPFAYWRFEQFIDQHVPNEMGENLNLVLHAEETDTSVSIENGVGLFRASPTSRYFSVDEGLNGWNEDEFSIELWVCPQRISWMTLVDVLSEDWQGDLNAVEIAFQSALIHAPGALRFFHRFPPAQDIRSGVNLFTQETCTPGQWHHIVVCKTENSLSMFVNGMEIRRYEGEIKSDSGRYQLSIGQMDQRLHRQFEGALDEIALYKRALSAEEIRTHYNLISK